VLEGKYAQLQIMTGKISQQKKCSQSSDVNNFCIVQAIKYIALLAYSTLLISARSVQESRRESLQLLCKIINVVFKPFKFRYINLATKCLSAALNNGKQYKKQQFQLAQGPVGINGDVTITKRKVPVMTHKGQLVVRLIAMNEANIQELLTVPIIKERIYIIY
jgi:hypothetical protein